MLATDDDKAEGNDDDKHETFSGRVALQKCGLCIVYIRKRMEGLSYYRNPPTLFWLLMLYVQNLHLLRIVSIIIYCNMTEYINSLDMIA